MADAPKKQPDPNVQSGSEITPPEAGKVFPWLAQRTGLAQLVGAAMSWLNLGVIVRLQMPDGTVNDMPVARPVITAKNATLTLPVDMSSFGQGTAASLQQLTVVSESGDLLVCTPVGGGANVNILKPPKIRPSIASETIQGVVHNFTYGFAGGRYTRTDTWAGGAAGSPETQLVTPDYLPGDLILALGGVDLSGREWAKVS